MLYRVVVTNATLVDADNEDQAFALALVDFQNGDFVSLDYKIEAVEDDEYVEELI